MSPRRAAVARHQSRLSRAAAPEVVAGSPRRRQPGAPVLTAPSPARTRVGARQENPPGRDPDPLPAAIAERLRTGKFEQTCRACGRCEAAGGYCSWCGRRMGPDDWYPNSKGNTEHAARVPATAPTNPPTECRRTYRPEYGDGWPPRWGPNPYEAARPRRTPVNARLMAKAEATATPDPAAGFWRF